LAGDAAGAAREAEAIVRDVERLELDRAASVSAERVSALAFTARGELASAGEHLARAFEVARSIDLDGLPLALLHEAGARLAIARSDAEATTAALTELWKRIENADAPALIRAYESLRAESRDELLVPDLPAAGGYTRTTFTDSVMYTHVQTSLASFAQQQERVRHALSLLLADCGASAGHLLLFDQRGLFAAAAVNQNHAGEGLLRKAQAYLENQLEVRTMTVTADAIDADGSGALLRDGDTVLAPVALVDRGVSPPALIGVALVAVEGLRAPRAPRNELVRIVSRCLQEAGDSVGVVLEE